MLAKSSPRPMIRNLLLGAVLCAILFAPINASASQSSVQQPLPQLSGAEIVALINSYRVANGLPALVVNSTLMALGQGQADYMASTTTVTHTGPGGTTPKDRAAAVGYGGGKTFFLSELIYGGNRASAETAVNWWKQSPNHNPWMLYDGYNEIGAGVAYADNYVYFAAQLGYQTGSGTISQSADSGDGVTETSFAVPPVIIIPVERAKEKKDGSIVHVVRSGQALWNIAAVYEVPLEELLELNELTKFSYIYPGDEILVRPPVPTPTPTLSPTATEAPPTPVPTLTPTRRITVAAPMGTPASNLSLGQGSDGVDGQAGETGEEASSPSQNPTVRWIVILALGSLIAVMLTSMLFQRPASDKVTSDGGKATTRAQHDDGYPDDPLTAIPTELENDEG